MKEKKKSLFKGGNLNPFLVLMVMVLLCTVVSYFVTPGAYDRETVNGVTRVVAGSYHSVDRTPVGFFQMMLTIPNGLTATASMMFAVMIIGGVVEIYNKTGVIGAGINSVLKIKGLNSQLVIAIVMILFFFIGGILGWSEHIIPFVPIVISLALSLGYDSLVGMAISGFACLIAFAVAPFNPFTVGTSHTIAELPMYSGWELRIIALCCVCALSLFWVLRYAKKIKADPSKSLVADVDTASLKLDMPADDKLDTAKILSLVVLAIAFAFTIYGMLNLGWSYPEMSAVFLVAGILAAILNRVSPTDTVNLILDGMRGAMAGALIIGAARAVQLTMTAGGLIDPLVHGLSSLLTNASSFVTTVGMFIMNFFINALIPSGSGQATAVMPIMVPLADMLGITRQTAVLAFQFGDGISNTFWFTNGTLLIYLGLAKVPLKSWYKFILPLHVIFFVLQVVFLFIALQIGYGPM
ncbi:MAG: YfcC family protein [Faecousia sp.]